MILKYFPNVIFKVIILYPQLKTSYKFIANQKKIVTEIDRMQKKKIKMEN